jgi:glycosyltransferase involved in cell wall biosynthesis
VRVAPNGVDVDAFRPAAGDGEEDTLLFFGTMNARMNADAAVFLVEEILPLIRARRPGVTLTIVGQNPAAQVLKLAQRPGVSVLGEVPDVRPHIARASVVMAPVRMGGGTKVKVLESMSMGKPVVATSHACRGLAVQDGVDVAMADSPADIAGRTVALLEDAEARRRLGGAARATVERLYSWDAVAALISDEMELAVERKRAAAGGRA